MDVQAVKYFRTNSGAGRTVDKGTPGSIMDVDDKGDVWVKFKDRSQDQPLECVFREHSDYLTTSKICSSGHPLELQTVGQKPGQTGCASHSCQGCGRTGIVTPEKVYRCQECNYDLCTTCLSPKAKQLGASGQPEKI